MQNKPSKWVPGFKHSPRSSNTQTFQMGLFLNVPTGKFEPIDSSWDNVHSGGLFISGANKIYFRDETNKDTYINSPADDQLALYASTVLIAKDTDGDGTGLVVSNLDTNNPPLASTIDMLEIGTVFGTADTYGFRLKYDGDTNNLEVQSGNETTVNTRMVIERDTGNVGIGVTPRDDWAANYTAMQIGPQGSLANYSDGRTTVGDNWYDDGAYKYIATDFASRYSQHNGEHLFDVAVSGSADGTITWLRAMDIEQGRDVKIEAGNLVMGAAGKGIDFSGAGTAAEILHDYEEGTWTCTVTGMNTTWTSNTNTGLYTRIGNQCTVWVLAYGTPATPTNNSTSYGITLSGLPFTILNDLDARSAIAVGVADGYGTNDGFLGSHGNSNATTISIYQNKDDGSTRTGPTMANSTATNIHLSFTYQVA